MLTTDEIFSYHLHTRSPFEPMVGFELEVFCLDEDAQSLIHYNQGDSMKSASQILAYLAEKGGFYQLAAGKTLGLQRNAYSLMLEPGSQFEFASSPHVQSDNLFQEFDEFLAVLPDISRNFGVKWLDVAFFPYSLGEYSELIPNPRYRIMDDYFQTTGVSGWAFLRYTTSLHINVDYQSLSDVEEKVNRILLAKPLLLMLAANSRIYNKQDSGYYSYRSEIYKGIDSTRTQAPGSSIIWERGRWTLQDYVTKVLNAPTIFSTKGETYNTSSYVESSHRPFRDYMSDATIDSYLLHNSTIFTDVRIKNYIEIRFLDNPGIGLVPAIVLLVKDLVYQNEIWKDFAEIVSYSFEQVPITTDLLNSANAASQLMWETAFREKLLAFVTHWRKAYAPRYQASIDLLIAKIQRLGISGI